MHVAPGLVCRAVGCAGSDVVGEGHGVGLQLYRRGAVDYRVRDDSHLCLVDCLFDSRVTYGFPSEWRAQLSQVT